MRRPRNRRPSSVQNIPVATAGMVENFPVAAPNPQGAEVLENFLPTQRGLRVRGGISRAAYVTDAVTGLFEYNVPSSRAFFAATANAVYNISSLNPTTAPAPELASMTSGDWSAVQMGTSGGEFLIAVNGAEHVFYWDGSDWFPITGVNIDTLDFDAETDAFTIGDTLTGGTSGATATIEGVRKTSATEGTLLIDSATGVFQNNETITGGTTGSATANGTRVAGASTITITGVDTGNLSHVWKFKSRLFFVEKNTLKFWYLPVDAIGGAASDFNLTGVFQRGGSLLMGGTWSLDSGDGMDDKCVFVSDTGEVAIYEGTDPSAAATWSLVGRYDVARPLGKRATMKAGGDFMIATVDGVVPLSQVIQKDPAALSLAAVTRPIEDTWKIEADRASGDVELTKWSDEGLGLVTLPDADKMLTVNLQTGAWAAQTGWYADCVGLFNGEAYIGRADGRVYKLNDTNADDGAAYTAKYCHSFFDFGDATTYKRSQLVRCSFYASSAFAFKVGVSLDYEVVFPTAPNAGAVDTDSLIWDQGNWDEKTWGSDVAAPPSAVTTEWRTVTGGGYVMAPTVQVTVGSAIRQTIELVRVDVAYEAGGRVV